MTVTALTRVERYVRNLDSRLATEEPAMQRVTLNLQMDLWSRCYENFINAIELAELDPPPCGPSIDDYLDVMNEITARLGRLA